MARQSKVEREARALCVELYRATAGTMAALAAGGLVVAVTGRPNCQHRC
jgi:hypothetical protein